MFTQTDERFAARFTKLIVSQFSIAISRNRANVFTQARIGCRELGRFRCVPESLAVEMI